MKILAAVFQKDEFPAGCGRPRRPGAIGRPAWDGALLLLAVVLLCLPFSEARAAGLADPFPSRHLNPIVQAFGLPPAEPAALTPKGRVMARLSFEGANSINFDSDPDQQLTLNGETYRTTIALRLGLADKLEVGLDLPWVAHTGGIFDGLIENFHDAVGISANSRDQVPRDQLTYRYVRNGETLFDIEDSVSGIGDLMVHGAVQLFHRQEPAPRSLAFRASLKLPTGDADKLTGSGSTDLAVELAASDSNVLRDWHFTLFGRVGALLLGDADLLGDQQRHLAGLGTFGFGWEPLRWLAFKLQMDAHTSFFEGSDINPIDSWATQAVGGFTFALPGDFLLDVAISENIFIETAPDVGLVTALKRNF